jgi:hypothetical protein
MRQATGVALVAMLAVGFGVGYLLRGGTAPARNANRGGIESYRKPSGREVAPPVPDEMPSVELNERPAPPASPSPTVLSKSWVDDAIQTRDPQLRMAALASIRGAIQSGEPTRVWAGLMAIVSIDQVTYDRSAYRDLVVPLLGHELPSIRAAALAAMPYTVTREGDLDLVVPLARDPSPQVRIEAARAIVHVTRRDLTVDSASQAIVFLLDEGDPSQLRQYILAIHNTKLSDDVERRLLDLMKNEDLLHDLVHGPLSTAQAKSPRVVKALIEILEGPDTTLHGQAIWGLQWNIPRECHGLVADTFARLLEARSRRPTKHESLVMIGRYGGTQHLDVLHRFMSNTMEHQGNMEAARTAIRQIRAREVHRDRR